MQYSSWQVFLVWQSLIYGLKQFIYYNRRKQAACYFKAVRDGENLLLCSSQKDTSEI
jgi:hypothetical protein